MESESLDTDMGLGPLHFPLDSDTSMTADGSLLSGLTAVGMIDDAASSDPNLSDGSMMTSAGMGLVDYVPHTAIDAPPPLSSFTNEMLFHNSPLPTVGSILATTHDHLYGSTLQRPLTPNSGHMSTFSPQPFVTNHDFNFQNTQPEVQYSCGFGKAINSFANLSTYQSTVAGNRLSNTNDLLSTYRVPAVNYQGPQDANQFQFHHASEAPVTQPQIYPGGVPQSNLLLNGATGFRQPSVPQVNTNAHNTNSTFTLRVPLPTAMTKGLRVHLVATGQGPLPITTGNNTDTGSSSQSTSNVMLFRDKVTGKNFLVPTGPPTITTSNLPDIADLPDLPNSPTTELSNAPGIGVICRDDSVALPGVKRVFDVSEFLNIPQKEHSDSIDGDTVGEGIYSQEPTNCQRQISICESNNSDLDESKLVIDETPSTAEIARDCQILVEPISHRYHTRYKSKVADLERHLDKLVPDSNANAGHDNLMNFSKNITHEIVAVDSTENTIPPPIESQTVAPQYSLDVNSAKTGEDLIKLVSLMARTRNTDTAIESNRRMFHNVESLDTTELKRIGVENISSEDECADLQRTYVCIPQHENQSNSILDTTLEMRTNGESNHFADEISTHSYVDLQPVAVQTGDEIVAISAVNCVGPEPVSTDTFCGDNGWGVSEGITQQPVGGAIVQTEKRIASLVPDSMKDFVRDIFEDEDALDKECIKHIMEDTTAAPTAHTTLVTTVQSANCSRDCAAKPTVQAMANVQVDPSQCVLIDGVKRWKCNVCSKVYSTKHNLAVHIVSHCGVKPHTCNTCGKSFKQTSHLQTHLISHTNVKPHVCKICDKSYSQASHLKRHSAIHMERKPHICDICSRGFAFPSELRHHKNKHANGEENVCSDCAQSFDTPKALKHHMNAVHWANKEKLHCKECDREFVYPSQLRDHMMKHSGKRPFICGECGMDFMKEHHLKSHMFTHTGLQPHCCEICDKSFNQKANLQRHMLIHEENKFKCDICERTFSQPQILKSHVQTHAEEKAFQCSDCGKRFSRRHNLAGHMALHSGVKKYVCYCGASFTLKGNLNRHRNTKHGLSDASLLVSDDTAAEAAAHILNEMSAKRIQPPAESGASPGDFETCHAETSDGILQWPADINIEFSDLVPKKKRKSVPRKTKNKGENDFDEGSVNNSNTSTELEVIGSNSVKQLKPQRMLSKLSESDDSNLSPAKPSSARRKKKAVAKATSVQGEVEQDDVEQEWQRLAGDSVTPDQSQHAATLRDSLHDVQHQLSRVWTDLRKMEDPNGYHDQDSTDCHDTNTTGCHDDSNHGNKNNSDAFVMEVDEHGRPRDLVTILPL